MTLLVAAFGGSFVVIGLIGLVQPDRFRSMFTSMDSQLRFVLAIAIRVFMGALLWWLAEDLRHTPVMRVLAAIAIFAAVGILIMGRGSLDKLVDWWLSLSDSLLRLSALFAGAFGAYLVYVAV